MRLASGGPPVGAVMNPPCSMIRSKAERSTMRSLTIGKAPARHGSITISAPSSNLRMWSWQVAVPRWGPWACPLIMSEHVPQMPSRQSWSNVIGSRPSLVSRSLTTSSISRNDMSSLMSGAGMVSNCPAASAPSWRQTLQREVQRPHL